MKTLEFTERAGEDRLVRINIPVDLAGQQYHVVVRFEPVGAAKSNPELLTDDFVQQTAGKWVGEFPTEFQGTT